MCCWKGAEARSGELRGVAGEGVRREVAWFSLRGMLQGIDFKDAITVHDWASTWPLVAVNCPFPPLFRRYHLIFLIQSKLSLTNGSRAPETRLHDMIFPKHHLQSSCVQHVKNFFLKYVKLFLYFFKKKLFLNVFMNSSL